ncbi:MAG: glycosyltransferase family 4 protein [Muribaculaceae bacterium]|nr:glycosyltransferase family 4 protein [Muribaculaceae bacterium]
MNILHVVNVYFVLPFFIGGQFKHFKNKGHNLNVACSQSEYLEEYARNNGFDYIETPVNRSISIMEDIKSIRHICRFIKQKKIDTVVGHTPKGALLAMMAARICNVPRRIYFRHGLVYETSSGLKRRILIASDRLTSMCATKIVCVSQSVLDRSIEDKLAPKSKQIILGEGTCNGVDTEGMFNPDNVSAEKVSALKRKYHIQDGDYVIGYSGRLVRDKGIIELVDAFDMLKSEGKCKLLLVGMFEDRDALPPEIHQRIESDPDIIYTGFVNGGMENYYAIMDMYVLPSYREGFPTGVLEAQSMGLPVVTTRVTGCCDSIVDHHTGLFADIDAKDLASKINAIRRDNIIDGKNGRAWVKSNFDSKIVWKEIEDKLY